MLPGVSRIRRPHTPGSNLPAPVLKRHSCVSRTLSRIPIEQLPLFFFKAKPATARALLFSCPSLRVCSDAPGSSSRSLRSISLFSRLPTCVVHLPTVQRDVSQKSRVIIPKNVEQSGKTRRLFPDYSAVSRLFLRRRAAYPRCILNLCEEGKHRVPILCINFAAFSLFPSAGKLSGSIFRLHPYSFHCPFYNKTHSPRPLSQQSQNSQPKIPTCSDCPRTILYLISHFKNFSL